MKFEDRIEVKAKDSANLDGYVEIDAYRRGAGGPNVFIEKIEDKSSAWIEELSPIEAVELGKALIKAGQFAVEESE